jgi:hypothetical protein
MESISGRVATGMIDDFSTTGMLGTTWATGGGGQGVIKMPHDVARSAAVADEHDERHGGEEIQSVTSHC